jgi:hypothetical protein
MAVPTWLNSVDAATTGTNISSFTSAPSTVDGVLINTAGQRILVQDQTTASQNGIYTYTSGTTWTLSPSTTDNGAPSGSRAEAR